MATNFGKQITDAGVAIGKSVTSVGRRDLIESFGRNAGPSQYTTELERY